MAILALGVLIIVHEGGHFLIARLSGMRVDRFSIGFGPKLFSFKRGETVYQIAAIPLGGFVQIAGLNPGEEGMAHDDPRALHTALARLRDDASLRARMSAAARAAAPAHDWSKVAPRLWNARAQGNGCIRTIRV